MTADEIFWFDIVKYLKKEDRIDEVLSICERKLPIPAAFSESAICLRKKIRRAKKGGHPLEKTLKELYALAGYHRFLYADPTVALSTPFVGVENYPAFNVAFLAHKCRARKALTFDYADFGYKFFELLNKTDAALIKLVWGEPNGHKDPREVYKALWDSYVISYEEIETAREVKTHHQLYDALRKDKSKPKGQVSLGFNFTVLAILLGALVLILTFSACAGRQTAHPVDLVKIGDEAKSCETLAWEIDQNQKDIKELDKKIQQARNSALPNFILGGFYALDMAGAETAEKEALLKRNDRLSALSNKKECSPKSARREE